MARLTKEELLKKIDNEELKKKLSELTEEDLKGVVGGTTYLDGSPAPERKCEKCESTNVMLGAVGALCLDCGHYW